MHQKLKPKKVAFQIFISFASLFLNLSLSAQNYGEKLLYKFEGPLLGVTEVHFSFDSETGKFTEKRVTEDYHLKIQVSSTKQNVICLSESNNYEFNYSLYSISEDRIPLHSNTAHVIDGSPIFEEIPRHFNFNVRIPESELQHSSLTADFSASASSGSIEALYHFQYFFDDNKNNNSYALEPYRITVHKDLKNNHQYLVHKNGYLDDTLRCSVETKANYSYSAEDHYNYLIEHYAPSSTPSTGNTISSYEAEIPIKFLTELVTPDKAKTLGVNPEIIIHDNFTEMFVDSSYRIDLLRSKLQITFGETEHLECQSQQDHDLRFGVSYKRRTYNAFAITNHILRIFQRRVSDYEIQDSRLILSNTENNFAEYEGFFNEISFNNGRSWGSADKYSADNPTFMYFTTDNLQPPPSVPGEVASFYAHISPLDESGSSFASIIEESDRTDRYPQLLGTFTCKGF